MGGEREKRGVGGGEKGGEREQERKRGGGETREREREREGGREDYPQTRNTSCIIEEEEYDNNCLTHHIGPQFKALFWQTSYIIRSYGQLFVHEVDREVTKGKLPNVGSQLGLSDCVIVFSDGGGREKSTEYCMNPSSFPLRAILRLVKH